MTNRLWRAACVLVRGHDPVALKSRMLLAESRNEWREKAERLQAEKNQALLDVVQANALRMETLRRLQAIVDKFAHPRTAMSLALESWLAERGR